MTHRRRLRQRGGAGVPGRAHFHLRPDLDFGTELRTLRGRSAVLVPVEPRFHPELEECQVRSGHRGWPPFLRARRYMQSRQALLDYSLTQFFHEVERYRP